MNMKIRVRIRFLYLLNRNIRQSRVLQNVLFSLIVLVWNIFLKKLINLLTIMILKVIYLEYKHTIQLCTDIEFINNMIKGKTLDYTKLFSPNDFKKNDRVIKRIFKNE